MNSEYREYTYCPVCGQKLPEKGSRRFCHICGTDFEEMKNAKKFKFCPRCAAPVMDGKGYCSVCGMQLYSSPSSRYCVRCGHEIDARVAFCPFCGSRIERRSYASYPEDRPGAYNAGHPYADPSYGAETSCAEIGPVSNNAGYYGSRPNIREHRIMAVLHPQNTRRRQKRAVGNSLIFSIGKRKRRSWQRQNR